MTKDKGHWKNKVMELESKFEGLNSKFEEMSSNIIDHEEEISKLKEKLKYFRIKLRLGNEKIKVLEIKLQAASINVDQRTDISEASTLTIPPETYKLGNAGVNSAARDNDESEHFDDFVNANLDDYDTETYDYKNKQFMDMDTDASIDDKTEYGDTIESVVNSKVSNKALKKFSCSYCPKTYTLKYAFEKHLNLHLPYKCTKCTERFAEESELTSHVKKHDDIKKSVLNHVESPNGSSSNQKMKTPKQTKKSRIQKPYSYTCRICKHSCHKPMELTNHFKDCHSADKAFQCPVPECRKGFVLEFNLTTHMASHDHPIVETTTTPATPTISQKISKKQSESEEFHQCVVCNDTFPSSELLYEHLETHNDNSLNMGDEQGDSSLILNESYVCSECNSTFTRRKDYKRHLKTHQNDQKVSNDSLQEDQAVTEVSNSQSKSGSFHCAFCKHTFVDKELLMTHVNSKHGWQKNFKCKFCEKSYFTARMLNRHLQSHVLIP